MSDVQIGDVHYRCGKMPTRIQWHVIRRLMPVIQGLLPVLSQNNMLVDRGDGTMVPNMSDASMYEVLAALANTLGMLSDADADYIIDAALYSVSWRQGRQWLPLRAQGGAFTNGSADEMDVQIRLLWEVLKESLANFSFATVLPSQTTNGLGPPMETATAPPTAA